MATFNQIEKYFDHYIGKFKENTGDAEAQVEAIEELRTILFTEENIYLIWEKYLMQLKKKIKAKYKGFFSIPAYIPSEPEEWLEEEIEQNRNNKLRIREELNSLKNLYHALNDLNEYENTLAELSELSEELNKAIKALSS